MPVTSTLSNEHARRGLGCTQLGSVPEQRYDACFAVILEELPPPVTCNESYSSSACRCSPESVTLAILAALQQGDVQEAVKFFMWPGGRARTQLPFLLRSFQGGSKRMLLHHEKVKPISRGFHAARGWAVSCGPCLVNFCTAQ